SSSLLVCKNPAISDGRGCRPRAEVAGIFRAAVAPEQQAEDKLARTGRAVDLLPRARGRSANGGP
ncbi:MAG TPA: hypothetical protein VLS27_05980, partial [Gammaproteobacteria bacterium]|nr:hypothetical protein [Gammaproteobacteria bacterium]